MTNKMHITLHNYTMCAAEQTHITAIVQTQLESQFSIWMTRGWPADQDELGFEITNRVAIGIRLALATCEHRAIALHDGKDSYFIESNIPEQGGKRRRSRQKPIEDSFFSIGQVLDVRERMKCWLRSALSIDKGVRRFFRRIDRGLKHKQVARYQKQFLERQHQMLTVIDQAERQRDVKLSQFEWIEIIDRQPAIIDLQSEHLAYEHCLTDQVTL